MRPTHGETSENKSKKYKRASRSVAKTGSWEGLFSSAGAVNSSFFPKIGQVTETQVDLDMGDVKIHLDLDSGGVKIHSQGGPLGAPWASLGAPLGSFGLP